MKRLTLSLVLVATLVQAQLPFHDLHYRNFGPWRAGAWISDIAVPETDDAAHRYTFYVAARHGGVWKTENNGTTFRPIFDDYGCNSIGAVEVAPSNPNLIWVGTGEASNARSAHAGNGIWKSTDGGATFSCMGLEDSHHIARILIHPHNENIVYAAVMGHLFTPNAQRGVFRSLDGGKSWRRVLFINDQIGVIDLTMNRENPHILYAAAYDKRRLPWHFEAGGPESGIYRSEDGGESWSRLSNGLPAGNIGRIGLDVHRADPSIVYAVVENLNERSLTPEEEKKRAAQTFDPMKDPYYDYLVGGEVYRSTDGGESWSKRNAPGDNVSSKAAYSFNQIGVDPVDPNNLFINSVNMYSSHDGGATWHDLSYPPAHRFVNMFGDVRCFWIDPKDPRHMLVGSDGGLYASYDGGRTTDHHANLPLGEVYRVAVDNATPYHIYAGLQDHEVWRAPVNGWSGRVGVEDWCITGLWDGMYTVIDHETGRYAYFTSQFGMQHRLDMETGTRVNISPQAAPGEAPVRHCWVTPIALSPHNAAIVYTGGQRLYRSLDRGNRWQPISPDLTRNDTEKIAGRGHMMYCTITTISESPITPGVIWAGTDDGRVHVTRDHGATWTECTKALSRAGAPKTHWVDRVVASSHVDGRAYVVKSGYRHDDFTPYLLVTEDDGQHWRMITEALPEAPVNVVAESRLCDDLLFAGTDDGVYASFDAGASWAPFKANMPPAPVKDLLIHPATGDLVVATYGRGVWIADVWPLAHLTRELQAREMALLPVKEACQKNYSDQSGWGNYELMGDRHVFTTNASSGVRIYYWVGRENSTDFTITIKDGEDEELKYFDALSVTPGLHSVFWETARYAPGQYRAVLEEGGVQRTTGITLMASPVWPVGNQAR